MIAAIDLTTAPSADVPAATVALITALARPGSPAGRRVVLCREEHRRTVAHATYGLDTVLTLEPPGPGRQQVFEYRRRKSQLLAAHGASVLHVAGGGPLDLLAVGLPVVISVDGLEHRTHPARFTPAERWHHETWWTAAAFRADAVVVPTDAVRDDLREQLGVDPAKVYVSPASSDRLLATLAAAYRSVQSTRKAA